MDSDFRIGEWIVRPRRDCIERDGRSIHLAPRAMAVLVRLASAGGQVVGRQELFDTVWSGCVVTDDALTQRIAEIRKAFGETARNHAIIETIPKVGFRLVPPAVPLPESRIGPQETPELRDALRKAPRVRTVIVGVIAVLTAVWSAYYVVNRASILGKNANTIQAHDEHTSQVIRNGQAGTVAAPGRSIVVLPFTTFGSREEDKRLANAMHEEVLTRLAGISSLTVIAGTSSEKYRDTDIPLAEVARDLNVATVLTGSVQVNNAQLRVRTRLLDAASGRYIWAWVFDRDLTAESLFQIQSEIAESVAKTLQASLSPQESAKISSVPTRDLEAYWLLLEGHAALKAGTRASVEEAIEDYERALKTNPGFALAYLAMAKAYWVAAEQRGVPDTRALAKIEYYSRKALDLDPTLGLAYSYLGQLKRISGRYEEAETLLRKAVQLDPGNVQVLHALGLTLRVMGRTSEAIPYYDRAVRLDPYSPIINESRGSLLRDLGRFKEAETQYRRTLEIAPDFVNTYWGLGTLYWSMGHPKKAIPWFTAAVRLTPQGDVFRTWLALMDLEVMHDGQARSVIRDAQTALGKNGDNDTVLAEELLDLYQGKDLSQLQDGRTFMFRYWYGRILDLPDRGILAGQFATAIKDYEARFPGISTGALAINASNIGAAIYVAYALNRLGERQPALRLLDEAEACLKGMQRLGIHGYWVADAQIQAIRGDLPGSLKDLDVAVNSGWRNLWRFYLLYDPILRPLHGLPGYESLVARVRSEMTDQA